MNATLETSASSRQRCPRCQRPCSHCLCAEIPFLNSRTRVLILQHVSERHHALNTARLVALGLSQAQLMPGERFEPLQWRHPQRPSALLFPGDDAQVIQSYVEGQTPWQLIVLDGTWRKARKLLHCNPELAQLPRLTLPPGPISRYRLRKSPHPHALSTIEAIVNALNILETPDRFDSLLRPFDRLIDDQIAAMPADVFQRHHQGH